MIHKINTLSLILTLNIPQSTLAILCPTNYYSPNATTCLACPTNTYATGIDSLVCKPNTGYYFNKRVPALGIATNGALTQTVGGLTYVMSASSTFSNPVCNIFTYTLTSSGTNQWSSQSSGCYGTYSSVNVYKYSCTKSTTLSDSSVFKGEWVQIKIPNAITLSSYGFAVVNSLLPRAVSGWVLAGSRDGVSWNMIHNVSAFTSWATGVTNSAQIFQLQAWPEPYTYFRLIVTSICSSTYLTIDELMLFDNSVASCTSSCQCNSGETAHCSATKSNFTGTVTQVNFYSTCMCCANSACYADGVDNLSSCYTCPAAAAPTTAAPTTSAPTTAAPTTAAPTTAAPTTVAPTTAAPTTAAPTTAAPTTAAPTTAAPTTTTAAPTTEAPTTEAPTTAAPTTAEPTTAAPTTAEPTTAAPTTSTPPTTPAPCAEGFYMYNIACTPCPTYTNSSYGATSILDCRCLAGYVCQYKKKLMLTLFLTFDQVPPNITEIMNTPIVASVAQAAGVPVSNIQIVGLVPLPPYRRRMIIDSTADPPTHSVRLCIWGVTERHKARLRRSGHEWTEEYEVEVFKRMESGQEQTLLY